MPIQSTADYIPVMDEFVAHWETYGDGSTVIILNENDAPVTLDAFSDLRAALDATKTLLQSRLNDLENARVVLEQTRQSAGDRIAEFNRRIRADFPNNTLFNRLPAVPNRTAGREGFMSALDDALDLWTRVNAQPPSPVFTGPLVLIGNFDRADMQQLRADLDAAFTDRAAAELGTAATRIPRNEQQDRAQALMRLYRMKVEGLFAPDSAAVISLPRLTPLPGHTPEPVELTGDWDIADARAELSWTESADADLLRYEIRSTPGPEYLSDDEITVATVLPGAPREFQTSTGFSLPGNAVSYRVYVRLNTGNEAGSETVTVTRPV